LEVGVARKDETAKVPYPESDEERALIESTEHGEWQSVGDIAARREFWREAAKDALGSASRSRALNAGLPSVES
jgi:hypothetical protein